MRLIIDVMRKFAAKFIADVIWERVLKGLALKYGPELVHKVAKRLLGDAPQRMIAALG